MIHNVKNHSISVTEKFIEQTLFSDLTLIKDYSSAFVLTDENTRKFCYPIIEKHLPLHVLLEIRPGEGEKNIETCKYLWQQLSEHKAERKSILINLGGGVIGDMGAFVASTYNRGMDFINIPTTLLAQVDASIGGKTGIDFMGIKNQVGLFADPALVIICTEFLDTLPSEQVRSGFAEILKHALIYDKQYWDYIHDIDFSDSINWLSIINTSINIKKQIVESDPKEHGLRKILNFGHTIGHAIETWSLHNDKKPLLHGEAIAIGMICETWMSKLNMGLSEESAIEITNTIFRYFEKYALENVPLEKIFEYMMLDKKNENGSLQFSLISEIGKCAYNVQVTIKQITESINYYIGL